MVPDRSLADELLYLADATRVEVTFLQTPCGGAVPYELPHNKNQFWVIVGLRNEGRNPGEQHHYSMLYT